MTFVSCFALRFPRSPIGVATILALAIALTLGRSTASAATDAPTSGPEPDFVEVVERAVAPASSLAPLPSDDAALAGIVETIRSSPEHGASSKHALMYAVTARALLAARGVDTASLDEPEVLPVTVPSVAANAVLWIGIIATICLALAAALRRNRARAHLFRANARIDVAEVAVSAPAAHDALVPVVFDPTVLVGAVVAEWRPEAAAKGVTLTLNVGSLPWRVVADMRRLRAVIDHTLRAVVRGTSATRVHFEVDADASASRLRIVVRDDRPPAPVAADDDPARARAAAMGGTYRLRTSPCGDTLCRIVLPWQCADADDVAPAHGASPRHLRDAAPLDAAIVPAAPDRPHVGHAVLDAPVMHAIEARLGGAAGRRLAAEFVLSLGQLVGSARASFAADDRVSLEATLQTMAGLAETFGCLPIVAAVRATRADPPTARFGRVLAAIAEVFPRLAEGTLVATNETVPPLGAAA